MEVWPQIIAGKVCRTEVLPRPRSFRRGSVPAHCRGRRPRRAAILFPKGIFRAPECGSLLAAATCRLFPCMPPAGNVPRPRARVTFGRSPKSDQKVCLKPQVSRLPARLTMSKNMAAYPAKAKIYADRRTTNRVYSSYRCRSHAPRGDAPVCYRAAGLLRPYRRFPEYRRTQIDAPRRGRRPRRPVAFLFPHASGEEYSAPRARVTFGRSPKSDQKCCLKPQVSRLPARLTVS